MTATLITGASTGIGRELARVFAGNGHNLVLVSRSKEKLESLAAELTKEHGIEARALAADLSRREAPEEVFAEAKDVDILVNNAGFGQLGLFADADLETQTGMIDLNVTALTRLTRLYLPGMRAAGRGRILNVASTAAFQSGPNMSVYYATKAYVLNFTEGLAEDLKKTGVTATCLCPGPTESDFHGRAGTGDIPLLKMSMMSAARVARIGYRACMKGKVFVVPGFMNRMGARSAKFFPRWMTRKIVRRMQKV